MRVEQRCDLHGYRGKAIVVTDSNTQVVIDREEGAVSLDAIVAATLGGTDPAQLLRAGARIRD